MKIQIHNNDAVDEDLFLRALNLNGKFEKRVHTIGNSAISTFASRQDDLALATTVRIR